MSYLIDTSAVVRIVRRQVDPAWHETVARGLVAICEPVITETVVVAGAREYPGFLAALTDAYVWVAVPDDAWPRIAEIRGRLAKRSAHPSLSVADYLVVVTARHHDLTVLHQDDGFATVASVVPELRQERINPAG